MILPDLAPECKNYTKLKLKQKDLEQAQLNAGTKKWALLIKEKRRPGFRTNRKVAIIDYDYFVELYRRNFG